MQLATHPPPHPLSHGWMLHLAHPWPSTPAVTSAHHTCFQPASSTRSPYPFVARWVSRAQPYHLASSYGLFRRMTGVGDREGLGGKVARPELEVLGSGDGQVRALRAVVLGL